MLSLADQLGKRIEHARLTVPPPPSASQFRFVSPSESPSYIFPLYTPKSFSSFSLCCVPLWLLERDSRVMPSWLNSNGRQP
jgi:hypothetical protein